MENNDYNEDLGYDDEDMKVTLELEDGTVTCAIIVILTVEEKDYIVLLPLDENGENEEGYVWIYRYFEDESNPEADPALEYIEDEKEYERVSAAYEEYLSETEHDEFMEEEDN